MCIRTVSSDDFHLVLDVLEKAFPDVSRRFFHAISQHDPWYDEKFCLAIETQNQLASSIQLFDRTILLDGMPVRTGGIGSVGTHPQFARNGYASRLIQHSEQVMHDAGMQSGFLFTNIQPFYEKLGWKILRLQEQEIDIRTIERSKKSNHQWKPVTENDLETLHSIYQKEQTHYSGTLQRTLPYWKARTNWMNHTGIVIWRDHEIVGYVYGAKYRDDIPKMHITEYGLKHHDDETANALFQSAKELALEKQCTQIQLNVLVHPFVSAFIPRKNWEWKKQPYNYIMWKDINRSGIYHQLEQLVRENRFIYWQTDAF